LIKIYTSEGLGDLARKSCTVILAVNPRDEEALSVQAALGGPLKQPLQSQLPKPAAPVTPPVSTPTATAPPAPVEVTASAPEPSTAPDLLASTPDEPEVDAADPNMTATEMLVAALRSRDQTKQSLAEPVMELPAPDRIETPPPSPHAEVVAQLESWLRTINSRRHDRDSTDDESDPKPS
jgi:hypothetical protein